jgi:dTDP-4-dehydrorhamnose 3,5-epimerase
LALGQLFTQPRRTLKRLEKQAFPFIAKSCLLAVLKKNQSPETKNQTMDFIKNSEIIEGLQIVTLREFPDERGAFSEIFRREWFPQVSWENLQSNRSKSKAHVLRGLHYHFHQVDYWYVPEGKIRAGLLDLRPHSPTYKAVQTIEMGAENNLGLFIPIGVAHGFYALTDCTLIYYVNNYYNSRDEFGVAWDDSALGLDWGNLQAPLVSERDMNNPLMAQIPADLMPRV